MLGSGLNQFPGYNLDNYNYSLNFPVSLVNVGGIVGVVMADLVVIVAVVVVMIVTATVPVYWRKQRRPKNTETERM